MENLWVGNCRQCGSIPGNGHSPFCSHAEQPKKCEDCGGTGTSTHQDGGPCAKCEGKGRYGGALEKYEKELKAALKDLPPFDPNDIEGIKRRAKAVARAVFKRRK
jgi:hypothetical protein